MAEQGPSIFNKTATEKLRSPDDLDKYVRVTNPSVWAILAACVLLLAGLLAWGVFGAVSTSVNATSVVVDGETICFLPAEDYAKVHVGDSATVGGERMRVQSISTVPLSRDEARNKLGSDYLVSSMVPGDWGYQITFEDLDGNALAPEVPLATTIVTERVAPISLIFAGR